MPLDSFIDPLIDRARHIIGRKSKRRTHEQAVHYSGGGSSSTGPGATPVVDVASMSSRDNEQPAAECFQNAHDLTFNNCLMVENMFVTGKTVLEILHPHITPEAAVDSSFRDPPPRCHPGTRVRINNYLEQWLIDPQRQNTITWLFGPAGAGKSAVAQTFAELCAERKSLGAAFFFSRPNRRDRPETVIPTIAYQLSTHCLPYKTIITHVLSDDPQLLHKAPHVQFKQLLTDPLSFLQFQGHESVREPFLVLLDGLDECAGERAQKELIRMISEVVRLKRGFPILWLICSRPEPHLHHAFSRLSECNRKELELNKEYRDDVEKFLRDGFAELKEEYEDIMPLTWPSDRQFIGIRQICSAPFVVASVVLKYIGDSHFGNPVKRLETLLSSFGHPAIDSGKHPLSILDLLYSRILEDIPEEIYPTTRRILSVLIYLPRGLKGIPPLSCQALCNLLRIEQSTFYSALRRLHSLYYIPSPEHAANKQLYCHHASFDDFICNPKRSEKFAINRRRAQVEIAKALLFWHELDTRLYHTIDEVTTDSTHDHGCLPHLVWASPSNQDQISREIARFSVPNVWRAFTPKLMPKDDDFLAQVERCDFRYIRTNSLFYVTLMVWLISHYPSNTIIHTEPTNEVDFQLLEYLKVMTNQQPVEPAQDLINGPGTSRPVRKYFFFGSGARTILLWTTDILGQSRFDKLNADCPPQEKQIAEYQEWLVDNGWYTPQAEENVVTPNTGEEEDPSDEFFDKFFDELMMQEC